MQHGHPSLALRIGRAIATYFGFGVEPLEHLAWDEPASSARKTSETSAIQHRVLAPKVVAVRRHPALRAYCPRLTDAERIGRQNAVRGLRAARANALDIALHYFMLAARCPDVDLTAVPGFWDLTSTQMRIAAMAYEKVERYRDAAALDAHISTWFRPRPVS